MGTATSTTESGLELLRRACARNQSVELHFDPAGGRPTIARARLLRLTDDAVLIDTPRCRHNTGPIPPAQPISAHFSLGGNWYAFRTTIEPGRVRIELNRHHRVTCLALRIPDTVEPLQRRRHYRVGLAKLDDVAIRVARAHPEIQDACPLFGDIGAGRIVNLAAGGMALLLDEALLPKPNVGEHFYLRFLLPGCEHEFCMLSVTSYASHVRASSSHRLGVEFVPWSGQDFVRCQRQITQAATDIERRALRCIR